MQNLSPGQARFPTVQAGGVHLHVIDAPIPIGESTRRRGRSGDLMGTWMMRWQSSARLLFGSVLTLIFASVGGSILASGSVAAHQGHH